MKRRPIRKGKERVNAVPKVVDGIKFDSTLEANFYKEYKSLNLRRIERKEKTFTVLIPRTWSPDFQVGRYYVETKGVVDAEWKRMFEVFCKQNPHLLDFVILVFDKDSKFPRTNLRYVDWATNLGVHCCVHDLDNYQRKLLEEEVNANTKQSKKQTGATSRYRRA